MANPRAGVEQRILHCLASPAALAGAGLLAILTTLGGACEAGPEPVPGANPQHAAAAAAPPAEDAAPPVEDDDDLPDELFCPITYTMMRDPVRVCRF